jgi:hypothetical protein
MLFSSVNFSNEITKLLKDLLTFIHETYILLVESFYSPKVIFESPLIFVKNLLKALATSSDSETDQLLMGVNDWVNFLINRWFLF